MSNRIAEHHPTTTTTKTISEIQNQWTNGHRRKARKLCYRLLKEKPDLPEALHISALMHHQDGNALDAIRDLEKACSSFDPQTVYFTDLSAILSNSGYTAPAKTVLTQALKRKPLDPKLLLQMGIFLTGNNGTTGGTISETRDIQRCPCTAFRPYPRMALPDPDRQSFGRPPVPAGNDQQNQITVL
ncbi:tetratricopeptide repeat protein [Thalassospira xianhensis]|nr:hypothetical protein [Thalassospira xianhensis]